MADFEYVDLVFENCNSVRLKAEDVFTMSFLGITESIWTSSFQDLIEHKVCKSFSITISASAEKTKTHFENDKVGGNCDFTSHINVFKDIAGVNVGFGNGKEDIYILVPYHSKGESSVNKLQRTLRKKEDQPFTMASFTIEVGEIENDDTQ